MLLNGHICRFPFPFEIKPFCDNLCLFWFAFNQFDAHLMMAICFSKMCIAMNKISFANPKNTIFRLLNLISTFENVVLHMQHEISHREISERKPLQVAQNFLAILIEHSWWIKIPKRWCLSVKLSHQPISFVANSDDASNIQLIIIYFAGHQNDKSELRMFPTTKSINKLSFVQTNCLNIAW